jgi:GWxTD domain-containing protein
LDYAQFAYDSTSNYIEFYYLLKQNEFKIIKENNKHSISIKITFKIKDTHTQKYLIDKDYIVNKSFMQLNELDNNFSFMGVKKFIIPDGKYLCKINIVDSNDSTNRKELTENIAVKPFGGKGISISEIQLAQKINNVEKNTQSVFYKNNLEVIPNPTILYSDKSPVLYYYSEIYNLQEGQADNYNLSRSIYDSKENLIYFHEKNVDSENNSIIDLGVIGLSKFPTDTYRLVITLIDTSDQKIVRSIKRFYVYNPNVKLSNVKSLVGKEYMSSEFGVLSSEECDDLFDKAFYIATKNEITQYNNLDSLAVKRSFMYNFWKARDTDLSTLYNEDKNDYYKRVEYCNIHFKAFNKKGYKTDRGRIYLQYGEFNQIDRYPNETNRKPYEIWYYHSIEGGVIFVFGDLTGFSEYELLHSDKRGELRNENWLFKIQLN